MYLKRLELQGFKSFSEKIRLEFGKGITAVVGPNGSGKSNISDAIRWVLGEQSAKSLRGAKMEDVIFAGTQNRRPLGFAEVSMIIDNADNRINIDYSEIKITRRVYRSGESEYQINGTSCRLKDIHQMFMDTGVGKEGYSIIGQGRIDEILSARSEDRRLLFEEAAGIVKYKNRKNETLSKLERERQNLLRVDDIISELEAQVSPLETQAEKAKQYLSLKEEQKLLQVNLFLGEIQKSEDELLKIEETIKALEEQRKDSDTKKIEITYKIDGFKTKVLDIDTEMKAKSEELVNCRLSAEQKGNDINLTKEQTANLQSDISRMEDEISKKSNTALSLSTSLNSDKAKYDGLSMEIATQKLFLANKEEEFELLKATMSGSEQQIDSFNAAIIEKIKASTDIKGSINLLKSHYEQLETRKEQLNDEKNYNESQINEKNTRLHVLNQSISDIDSVTRDIDKEQVVLNDEDSDVNSNLQVCVKDQDVLVNKLNIATSKHKVLSDMEKGFEGYYRSVKAVLLQKETNPQKYQGICGAVGGLLETEEKYELAVEIALGSSAQNIITKTENDARQAMEYLKNSKEGRATFLPLTAIKPRDLGALKGAILKEPGVMGVAVDLIRYSHEYESIFSNILGKVVIIDNIENGLNLFKKYNYAFKVVSQEGDLLNVGGAMTGGSVNHKNASFFGRSREIKELKEKITIYDNENQLINSKILALKQQLDIINSKMTENNRFLQEKALEKASCTQNIAGIKETLGALESKREEYVLENSQLMEQLLDCNKHVRDHEQEHVLLEKEIMEMQGNLTDFQSSMTDYKTVKDEKTGELTDLKVAINSKEQNLLAVSADIKRVNIEIIDLEKEIVVLKQEIAMKKTTIDEKTKSIQDIQDSIDKVLILQNEIVEQMAIMENDKEDISEQLSLFEEDNKGVLEIVTEINTKLTRLEMKNEQVLEERRKGYDEMWDEYKITFQTAKEYPKLDIPFDKMKKDERDIKTIIQELGYVNVGAIEEYKLVKERFEIMSKQRDDIIDAEEKLVVLIKELTQLMEDRFREQFSIISENFAIVFREMFGGGKADLRLADENNILESGIDIVAQPPGKNLQNMSLLSGGERALTATALLFGILRMKPSPFCILDEVEAALDDANVDRYANFLKNFSHDTQFILITHRKGTMEVADVLYGVTMQEQGISKLVSVNFEENTV